MIELIVSEDDLELKRLDRVLSHHFPDLSRNFLKKLFDLGEISSPHTKIELKKMPPVGTLITINLPEPTVSEMLAEDIPLNIVYEDEHLLVINKDAGMVVHPAPGNYTGTLVNALLYYCKDLQGVGNVKRPGIVHRLDKGTSGIMVVAKNQTTHDALVKIFAAHDILREYETLVIGNHIQPMGKIQALIGRSPFDRKKMKAHVKEGKEATTHYFLQKEFENYCHLKLRLETGRTHQIRVHLSQVLGHPILGDQTYGNVPQQIQRIEQSKGDILKDYPYPILHAKVLGFTHPQTGEELLFESELPEIFSHFLV